MDGLNRDILKRVLSLEELTDLSVDGDDIIYDGNRINAYKFAHKNCKDWSWRNERILFTATVDDKSVCIVNLNGDGYDYIVYKESEHEAIFDAINWCISTES
jgi:hypothetical protein